MTSIVQISPAHNIYEQVKWKCKAYSSMFSAVLMVQVLMALLSGSGSGSMGMGRGFINYREKYYTLDGLFIFSMVTLLFIGWILASKVLSRDNFSIVTTYSTEVISTLLFIVLLCMFTLLTALCSLSISVFLDIVRTGDMLMFHSSYFSMISLGGFIICTLLAASIGYFLHVVFDFSKIAFVLLVAVLFFFIRQYTIDLWGILFGHSPGQVIGRSALYTVILWLLILIIRKRREVIR